MFCGAWRASDEQRQPGGQPEWRAQPKGVAVGGARGGRSRDEQVRALSLFCSLLSSLLCSLLCSLLLSATHKTNADTNPHRCFLLAVCAAIFARDHHADQLAGVSGDVSSASI